MLTFLFKKKSSPKRILFYRDFVTYSGGHQKVADYFNHVRSTKTFLPAISFSKNSVWNNTNPWFTKHQHLNVPYQPENYHYAFLAGMDWQKYLQYAPTNQPAINLIQHVRHADANENVYSFLQQKAIRICVSEEVADAINATKKVNGPVFVIPNGLELPQKQITLKQYDVLILGTKQPELAQQLYDALHQININTYLVKQAIPKETLHKIMAQSSISLLLPNYTEGFYLPAIESMHFCDVTIVPDCVGNRSFCKNEINCLMPSYNLPSLLEAFKIAKTVFNQPVKLNELQIQAKITVAQHSLIKERVAFLNIMNQVDELWHGMDAL